MPVSNTDTKFSDNLLYLSAAANGDKNAISHLMEVNGGLVRGLASRFMGRGVEYDDLVQIGSIGMLKAIRSFDISRGTAFSTYAVPLIIGEIRRYLRDDGLIKVGRRQKQLGASVLKTRERFIAEKGREPHIRELAEELGISEAEVVDALDAVSPVHSISESLGENEDGFTFEQVLAGEDEIDRRVDQIALRETINTLPPLWKKILFLRYFRELSQQEAADRLGLTQVKISREEKKIFAALRIQLTK